MTNPLRSQNHQAIFTSGMRALDWAAIARSKGLVSQTEQWERAASDGWDDRHFCPLKAEQLDQARRANRQA